MGKKGKIYFVGVPSGGLNQMPLKAVDALSRADIIVYDNGVDEDIISISKKNCNFGGGFEKNKNFLLDKIKEGKSVACLEKEGPFISGWRHHGIEDAVSSGVSFEVIPCFPDVLASIFAGIPFIHQKFGSNCAVIYTSEENNMKIPKDCAALVCYPGTSNIRIMIEKITGAGYRADLPAAVIKNGGSNNQEVVTGNLSSIADKVSDKKISAPFLTIVGETVGLRDSWRWFDSKPLFGRNIVVTRNQQQAREFSVMLEEEGARVIEFPTIEIVPALNCQDADSAVDEIEKYHWIIFTSSNGVKYFFERIKKKGNDLRCLKGIKICAIGPGTAKTIENSGIKIDFVPKEYKAEGIIEGLSKEDIRGKNILIPRAEVAREILPDKLEEMGANVSVVTVYRTVKVDSDLNKLKPLLENKEIDVITFTSFSTADNFISLFSQEEIRDLMRGVNIASIGPITSSRIEKAGLKVKISPSEYTLEKLMEEIAGYYEKRKN